MNHGAALLMSHLALAFQAEMFPISSRRLDRMYRERAAYFFERAEQLGIVLQ